MLSIHAIITRALEVSREKSEALAGQEDCAVHATGFLDYLRCLTALIAVHHDTEDVLAFPIFKTQVEAPYDLLAEQHRTLHALLEKAGESLNRLAADPGSREEWQALAATLAGIQEVWHPHIGIEEEKFTADHFAELMPPEEHARLTAVFMEHTQKNTGPDYLMVPFLLYNLPPDKRAYFAGEMPPVVVQELVPRKWRAQWAPMQPFLLPCEI
jgi:hemerythrin-like domain-containing protein